MSLTTPVTSPQKTQLRVLDRAWRAEQVIVCDPNVIVFAGQLNENTSTALTWAQFAYNNVTVGAYTDVIPDMVLLIGNSGDIRKATFRGRIRKAPTAAIVYCNESSADFVVGNYFWVLDTRDITDKMHRQVGANKYWDWDDPYHGMRPLVKGLQLGNYSSTPHAVTGKYRFTFTVTAQAAQSGGSISSYLFTFKSGTATVISGSLSSNSVTVDLTAGWQWAKLEVVDAAGVKLTRHFAIAADDGTLAATGFDGATITDNFQNGYSATVKAFDGVDDLLDNTFVIIARANETTGNVAGSAVGSTVDFVGWIHYEDNQAQVDQQSGPTADVTFQIAGVAAKLSKLEGQLIPMTISATPSVIDEIKQLTVWRAIYNFACEHTTAPNLCDFEFDSTSDDFLYPTLVTQEGKALANMQGLANQIDAPIEFAPDGKIYIGREAGYLYALGRNALPTIFDYTEDDIIGTPQLGQQRDHDKSIGKVDAVGACYNTTDNSTPGYEARAPGHAQDSADGSESLPNQVLVANQDEWAAKIELRYRAGNKLVISNNTEVLTVVHPDSYYSWLVPSHSQWYTLTLDLVADGMAGVGRIKLDSGTRWTLESISYTHDNSNGTRTGTTTYRKEPPFGEKGDDTTPVPQGSIEDVLPAIPPIEAFPGFDDFQFPDEGYLPAELPVALLTPPQGQVARFDGNETMVWDATHIWVSKTFIMLRSPKWLANTPEDLGSFEIKTCIFDPQYTKTSVGAYALASDGTNSAIWYTPNAFQPGQWVKGVEFAGVYTKIWGTGTAGQAMVYTPDNSAVTTPYDFTTGQHSFALNNDGAGFTPATRGQYVASSGWTNTLQTWVFGGVTDQIQGVDIVLTGTFTNVTSIKFLYDLTKGTFNDNNYGTAVQIISGGVLQAQHLILPAQIDSDGTSKSITLSGGTWSGDTIRFVFTVGILRNAGPDPGGSGRVFYAEITTGGGGANVRTTTDYGVTVSSTITVGTSPGALGGFDVIPVKGGVSLAAEDQQVKHATAIGGAYSNVSGGTVTGAEPVLLEMPYSRWSADATVQYNTSDPDYVIGLSALLSSYCLYRVAGATGVQTGITLTGASAVVGPNAFTSYFSQHFAVLAFVSGVEHVFTTANAGTTTADRGAVAGALYVRVRYKAKRFGQLFICGGATLKFTSNFGVSLWPRTPPVASSLLGIEVLG